VRESRSSAAGVLLQRTLRATELTSRMFLFATVSFQILQPSITPESLLSLLSMQEPIKVSVLRTYSSSHHEVAISITVLCFSLIAIQSSQPTASLTTQRETLVQMRRPCCKVARTLATQDREEHFSIVISLVVRSADQCPSPTLAKGHQPY